MQRATLAMLDLVDDCLVTMHDILQVVMRKQVWACSPEVLKLGDLRQPKLQDSKDSNPGCEM